MGTSLYRRSVYIHFTVTLAGPKKIVRYTEYFVIQRQQVLAAMLEGQHMPANMAAIINFHNLFKNQTV